MAVKVSMQRFRADVQRIVKDLGIGVDQVMRKIALDILTDTVRMTPVDTGRARASWVVGINAPGSAPEPEFVAWQQSLAAGTLQLQANELRLVFISSYLPYILPLEFGHSSQAPAGMVRIAVKNTMQAIQAFAPTRR